MINKCRRIVEENYIMRNIFHRRRVKIGERGHK